MPTNAKAIPASGTALLTATRKSGVLWNWAPQDFRVTHCVRIGTRKSRD